MSCNDCYLDFGHKAASYWTCIFKLFLFNQFIRRPELGGIYYIKWRHLYYKKMIQNTMNTLHLISTYQKNKEDHLEFVPKFVNFFVVFCCYHSSILHQFWAIVLRENGTFELNMTFILYYIYFCILHYDDLLKSHRPFHMRKKCHGIFYSEFDPTRTNTTHMHTRAHTTTKKMMMQNTWRLKTRDNRAFIFHEFFIFIFPFFYQQNEWKIENNWNFMIFVVSVIIFSSQYLSGCHLWYVSSVDDANDGWNVYISTYSVPFQKI